MYPRFIQNGAGTQKMPESAAGGFVFAGGEFVASLFDEHSLEEHLGNLTSILKDKICSWR